MKIIKKALIILLVASSFTVNAQEKTVLSQERTTIEQQSIFLDSMINRWQIKNAIKCEDYAMFTNRDSIISDVPDSVYIERLSRISSPITLTYNDEVKSWINLYLNKNRRTPYLIGLTEYYFPMVEEILDSKGLPLELKYMAVIESALNPQAVSRAGATGMWQFMYSTGKMYNLEINSFIDERKDPLKASEAAARYLKEMYDMFGDWSLVIASYNCGPGNVQKAIKRAKGKRNFWDIYQYLPRETRGYVPAFIAATYVMTYYKEHKVIPVKIDMNVNTDTIMISEKLHLMQVAEVLNIPMEELRYLNPQYKKDIIPGMSKSYPLRLPSNKTCFFLSKSDSIYAYKDSIYFDPIRVLALEKMKTSKYDAKAATADNNYKAPSTAGKRKITYIIKEGDTYGYISSWFDVRISDLQFWNNKVSTNLSIGQEVELYVPIKKYSLYDKINDMTFEQKQSLKIKNETTNNIATTSKSKVSNNEGNKSYVMYKIQQGDNLWIISQKYPGVSDKDIKILNGFTNNDLRKLQAGQNIKIKRN